MRRPRDRKRLPAKERRPRQHPRASPASHAATAASGLLFGLHAVAAAIANPDRQIRRLLATENAERRLAEALARRPVPVERALPPDLDRLLGAGAVHQGVALDCAALPDARLEDLAGGRLVVVLDQVTDPHNVGAVLRSAAAFGAAGVVMTARHSPAETGALAKAASGGLEHVPIVRVANLARSLAQLGGFGFTRIGLDGAAEAALHAQPLDLPLVLVLGAEGKGLRRLTRERCDQICRLATAGPLRSLNVSNAAAVALYTVTLAKAGSLSAD